MSLKQQIADENVRKLIKSYYEPSNELFLTASTNSIFNKLKKSGNVDNITTTDIHNFRNYLTDISREKERRILRGKKRKYNFRQVSNAHAY